MSKIYTPHPLFCLGAPAPDPQLPYFSTPEAPHKMALLRFWLCTILVLWSVVVSEPRSLPSSFESHSTESHFPLGADGIFIVVSGLKGMDNVKHNPNRLSPSGPDPKHH
ncbi:hypothetical protein E2542_SST16258 [Spatholobus suberectus]|nr:hypothetical protein E2542_SST16258 [Spatholobus suberectus]